MVVGEVTHVEISIVLGSKSERVCGVSALTAAVPLWADRVLRRRIAERSVIQHLRIHIVMYSIKPL